MKKILHLRMKKNKSLIYGIIIVIAVILINVISGVIYQRFDLTKDKRYTLSEASKSLISELDAPLIIDVFLEGDFPSEFRLLQTEVRQLLDEFSLQNNEVYINYINPIADESTRERNIEELTKSGLEPYVNTNNSNGKVTQELIFPWAFASYNDETVKIPLLKRSITQPLQEQITNSIQALEYAFADGFSKLVKPKSKKIAILKGNGELGDLYIADFLKTLQPYYNIAPFTLDSVASNAEGTLNKLIEYDLDNCSKTDYSFFRKRETGSRPIYNEWWQKSVAY